MKSHTAISPEVRLSTPKLEEFKLPKTMKMDDFDEFNIDSFKSESLSHMGSQDTGLLNTFVTHDDVAKSKIIDSQMLKFTKMPTIQPKLLKIGTT